MDIIQIGKFENKTFKFGDIIKLDLECDCKLVGFFDGFGRDIFGKQRIRMNHYVGTEHSDIITYVKLSKIKDINILEIKNEKQKSK